MRHPLSPQQARAQVVDAASDIINSLHAELTEATFSYESCNDQGEPPFRGVVDLSFWMPGVSHNGPADPKTLISALVADGWSTDSDFISHSPTLRKKDVNAIVTVVPPALHGEGFNSHVGVKLDGECRDTFDHRKDHSILPIDVSKEIQQS
ncbi:hypothetical protein B4U45_14110 [Mycobacterium persicum]|uniref:Lipoprotein LppJ n=1 Tax=Mycobacterium persicum TaxID=1487726 RepID=A0A8E2IZY5_9MYCO|nr:hypothetical protein A4G31_13270 [Mycobacterium persicum]ORB98272.1 hypothetical protein B1T44_15095 [Mycobacterium persicum]ORC10284.1 hypothetical protein B4U45_14110 [Mycobacterium persicum]